MDELFMGFSMALVILAAGVILGIQQCQDNQKYKICMEIAKNPDKCEVK